MEDIGFEMVGGGERFGVEPGSCGGGGLGGGDQCAAKVIWSGLESSGDAFAEVLVSATVESGRRVAQSLKVVPGRAILEKEERQAQLAFDRAKAEAAAEAEAEMHGPTVVGDPAVGMGGFGGEAARTEEEHLAAVAAEEPELPAEQAAVVRKLEEDNRLLQEQVASLRDVAQSAMAEMEAVREDRPFSLVDFEEEERERLAGMEPRLADRLRLWAMVRGVRGSVSAQGRLYSWPPERGLVDVRLEVGQRLEDRWEVVEVDALLGEVVFRDLRGGADVVVGAGAHRGGWWQPFDEAGRLVSREGYEEMRSQGMLSR